MKKVLIATASLMLAGAMTSTAFADPGVSFSGDARARVKYLDEYQTDGEYDVFFESRARLAFVGESKGGAYVKARFKLANGKWDGTSQTKGTHSRNISVDYAYLGVPMGPITIEAGLYDDRGITPFTMYADDVDTLQAIYQCENAKLTVFMDLLEELPSGSDDNRTAWGLVLEQGFSSDWKLVAGARYSYNPNGKSDEGFIAGLDVTGQVNGMTLSGGLGYKDDIFADPFSDDDAYGLWARLDAPVGAATVTVIGGATFNGYTADWGEFDAFYIFGDYTMISLGAGGGGLVTNAGGERLGFWGDTFWGVLRGAYQANENLSLEAQIAYLNLDYDPWYDGNAFEIGAKASYKILDGASLTAMVGYADAEDIDLNPLAFALSLDVKF